MFRSCATDFPLSILIETKSQCQGKCVFCPYEKLRAKKPVEMLNTAILTKVLQEISNYPVRRLSLFGNNEPLLDNRIVELVKLAHLFNPNCEITLSTNGILLGKNIAEALYDAGLSVLYVSVPTIKEYEYHFLMGARVSWVKKSLTEISLSRARSMIRIAVPETYAFDREEIKRFCEELGFQFSSWKLEYKMSWNLPYGYLKKDVRYNCQPCDRPMDQMCILANGNVVICCRDWNEQGIVGNVKQDSLYEIWHSDRMKKIQDDIAKQSYRNPVCIDCTENPNIEGLF